MTSLGYFDSAGDGLRKSHVVAIYSASGELLTSAAIAAGNAVALEGSFRYVAIAPLELQAGTPYVLAGTTNTGQMGGGDPYLSSTPTAVTWNPAVTFVENRIISGAALAYPATTTAAAGTAYFGPDFKFETAPAAPAPTVAGELSRDWVYQNTAATTSDRHCVSLSLAVSGTAAFTVEVTRDAASPGNVTVEPTADPLVWTVRGCRQPVLTGEFGPVTLNVVVTDFASGTQAQTQVAMACRQLGDIDGLGSVSDLDKELLSKRLNGLVPDGPQFDLDGRGGANGQDRLILNKILNGLPLP